MKRNTRLIHKWLGLISCLFILFVSLTAIALNHHDEFPGFLAKTEKILTGNNIKVLAADPFNNNRLIASDLKSLYESRDNSKTWTELKLFVPAENVNNIVFDPVIKDKLIVSLKEAGIFVSDDSGEVWDEPSLPFFPNEGEYIENLTLSKNQLTVKTRFALYLFNTETEKWHSLPFSNINKKNQLDFSELVYNIHTGRIFGEAGKYLYDVLSAGLIILAITGIYLSLKPRKRLKVSVKKSNKNDSNIKAVSDIYYN